MVKLVGVVIDGLKTVHAPSVHGDYDTLCGIDANDPAIGHQGTFEPHDTKFISCNECWVIWKGTIALKLREKDFSPTLRASGGRGE